MSELILSVHPTENILTSCDGMLKDEKLGDYAEKNKQAKDDHRIRK